MVLEINCKNFWFPTQSSAHVQFTSLDYCSSGKESQMSPGTFKFCNFIFISTISHQKIKKKRYVHVCVSQWLNKQRHFEIFIIRLLYTCYMYKLYISILYFDKKTTLSNSDVGSQWWQQENLPWLFYCEQFCKAKIDGNIPLSSGGKIGNLNNKI